MSFVRRHGHALRGAIFLCFLGTSGAALAADASAPCAGPARPAGGTTNAHTLYVEQNLLPAVVEAGAKPLALVDRMQAYGVPGVSVAVIHKGKLDWARGWGVRDASSCKPVTTETVFQAASISKVVTAVLALRLVEQGSWPWTTTLISIFARGSFRPMALLAGNPSHFVISSVTRPA
jgi:CubicO group peptidase (beta-lactamase class C family)